MLNSDPCPETGFGNICSQRCTTCKRTILSLYCVISNCYPLACVARGCIAKYVQTHKCQIDLCTDRSHSQRIKPYLIKSISRGACRQQRRNSLVASLYSGHVQARREWVRVIDVLMRGPRLPCKRESASVQVARVRTNREHGGRSTRTLTRRVSPRSLKSMTSPMACL